MPVVSRFVCAVLLLVPAALGCGGGEKPGKSLAEQYQDALALPDAAQRARRLVSVADKQQQAADLNGVSTSLAAAKDAVRSIEDPAGQASALILVAGACARLDQPGEVKQLLAKAAAAIDKIEEPRAKVRPLADLAAATSQHLGNAAAAAAHLKTAEAAADAIERPADRAQALGRIAAAYAKSDRASDRQRVLDAARTLADNQSDPRARADCLAEIAAALATMKSPEADAAFQAAQEAAGQIENHESQGYALLNIAEKAQRAKRTAQAKALLVRAQDVAHKIKDTSLRGPLLAEIDAALRQL